ncbi:MAG: acetylglucosamine transferase [Rubrivivax sp.]|nr:acetylglucosamine transferase [Rubrivivax sp.]
MAAAEALVAPEKRQTHAPEAPGKPGPALALGELIERAQALAARGQGAQAAALYEAWVRHNPHEPHWPVACFNWGTTLSAAGDDAGAEQAYRGVLARLPGFAPALLNLGHLHERRGAHEEALAAWQQVRDALPAPALEHRLHALNNRARLLEQLKRLPEAEAEMRASLLLKPAQPDVIQHFVHVRQKQCAWPAQQPVGEVTPYQLLTGTSLLAMMGLVDDPALQLLAAQRFVAEKVARPGATPLWQTFAKPADALASAALRSGAAADAAATAQRERRIRIGYLSGDLHMHAVGLLTAELFELHDRERFEVWAFDWTPPSAQPLRQRILRAIDRHVALVGVDDAHAARRIAEAGIDVLVDLQGLTNGARPGILVQRPAPVQVSYLGLPGTSALPGVDWMLADRFVMPPELLPYCSERPLYLPHCYQVSDRRREVAPPETQTRQRYGLPAADSGAFVFCSFNNNHKFTPQMFAAWMRIVSAVPGSVLWLLADNDTARANLLAAAQAAGVAAERLVFAPRVSPAEYLARFALADLVLDTFPFNAGTTASDALWMGTPIVTLAGRTFISRMAGSLLHAVGLPDLVTTSLAEYEKLAVTLGRTPARAASLKRYLAEHGRASPLFDVPQIVRDIEGEFERLARAARAAPGESAARAAPEASPARAAPGESPARAAP